MFAGRPSIAALTAAALISTDGGGDSEVLTDFPEGTELAALFAPETEGGDCSCGHAGGTPGGVAVLGALGLALAARAHRRRDRGASPPPLR